MLLDYKFNKIRMHLMQDKETIKLRKTKQRLSQFYQLAMDLMEYKELIA